MIPEDGVLVAHDTGEGWALSVENETGDVVCYLKWPDKWPSTMTTKRLKEYGFKIV